MDPAGYSYIFMYICVHIYVMIIIKRCYKFENKGGTWEELEGGDLGEADWRKRGRGKVIYYILIKMYKALILKHTHF